MRLFPILLVLSVTRMAAAQTELRGVLLGDAIRRREVLRSDSYRFAPQLVDLLRDGDPKVRAKAAAAFAEIDLYWEELSLASRIRGEKDEAVDRRVQLRNQAMKSLVTNAADSNPIVRDAAVKAMLILLRIRNFGHHGVALDELRVLKPLIGLGSSITPILVRELRSRECPETAKIAAVRVLARYRSPENLNAFLDAVPETYGSLLYQLTDAIADYDDPRVIPILIGATDQYFPDTAGSFGERALVKMGRRAFAGLMSALEQTADPDRRRTLLDIVFQLEDPRVLNVALHEIHDRDARIASSAAATLGGYPQNASVEALNSVANHPSVEVRRAVIEALGTIGSRAGSRSVRAALADPDGNVRRDAIEALPKLQGADAVPALLPFVSDPEMLYPLIEALRPLHDRRTVPFLIETLRRGKVNEAGLAATTLAEMGIQEAFPILLSRMDDLPSYVVEDALRLFAPTHVEALLTYFPKAGVSQKVVLKALGASRSPKVVDFILSKVDDFELGETAISSLEALGEKRAIPVLLGQLSSADEDRAELAVHAIGTLGTEREIGPLTALLDRPDVGIVAAEALAKLGAPESLDPIIRVLSREIEAENWSESMEPAIVALGRFQNPRALEFLLDQLEFGPYDDAAATALGELGDTRALRLLKEAAGSEHPTLATAAKVAIKKIQAGAKHG